MLVGGSDVHETAASPTIDAGSGALVPAGLTADVFGNPRIDPGGAATVDIGAAEYTHLPPLATTAAASGVSATAAQLSGSVNPRGTATSFSFQYGTSPAYGSVTPATTAGAGGAAVAASATLSALAPGTAYDYRIVATSPTGTAYGANMAFATRQPAPALSGLTQSHKRWRIGPSARAARRKQAAVGTTFSYALNVQATVTFTFTHRVKGRRVGGACVAKTRRNARKRRCVRPATAGILTTRAAAGQDRMAFAGILGGHRFATGPYTLHLSASNSDGVTSPASTIGFTIVNG